VIPRAIRRTHGVARLLAALTLGAALASPAAAQGLVGGSGDGPLEINASDGIEWRRDEQVYIARGDATASRGGVTVRGDRLIAHYRRTDGDGDRGGDAGGSAGLSTGGTEIYRVEAVGGVRIGDARATTTGDKAVYDLDQQVVVLTGEDLRFETEQETITAEDSLEYWQARNLAVARGDARAERDDRVIRAEVLAARFAPRGQAGEDAEGAAGDSRADADGGVARQQDIERIEAFENVRISTPTEFARGDRGVYDVSSEVATLIGNVRITRGENQLNGGWGQVNLRTGVSRLRGAPPEGGSSSRVRALLQPDSARDAEPSDTAQSEAEAADGGAGGGEDAGTSAREGASAADSEGQSQ
jgi:lipopolysaccharide export system protein LptA